MTIITIRQPPPPYFPDPAGAVSAAKPNWKYEDLDVACLITQRGERVVSYPSVSS